MNAGTSGWSRDRGHAVGTSRGRASPCSSRDCALGSIALPTYHRLLTHRGFQFPSRSSTCSRCAACSRSRAGHHVGRMHRCTTRCRTREGRDLPTPKDGFWCSHLAAPHAQSSSTCARSSAGTRRAGGRPVHRWMNLSPLACTSSSVSPSTRWAAGRRRVGRSFLAGREPAPPVRELRLAHLGYRLLHARGLDQPLVGRPSPGARAAQQPPRVPALGAPRPSVGRSTDLDGHPPFDGAGLAKESRPPRSPSASPDRKDACRSAVALERGARQRAGRVAPASSRRSPLSIGSPGYRPVCLAERLAAREADLRTLVERDHAFPTPRDPGGGRPLALIAPSLVRAISVLATSPPASALVVRQSAPRGRLDGLAAGAFHGRDRAVLCDWTAARSVHALRRPASSLRGGPDLFGPARLRAAVRARTTGPGPARGV